MGIVYPTRCEILDVTGEVVAPEEMFVDVPTSLGLCIERRTPEVSKPQVGKQGLAEMIGDDVRITLDDGMVLMGYECWWKPVMEQN